MLKNTFLLIVAVLFCVTYINAQSPITINEFMASNSDSVTDQDGDFDDWIELYNKSNEAFDLSGWHLSDNPDNLDKYKFPEGTIIGPSGFLIVWADEDGDQDGLHANFKLSSVGEVIMITDPDTVIVEEVVYGQQQPDMGYARTPNGTGSFEIQEHTFRANNDWTLANDYVEDIANEIQIAPNPASDWLNISLNGLKYQPLELRNILGQLITRIECNAQCQLDVSYLPSGPYFLLSENKTKRIQIQK